VARGELVQQEGVMDYLKGKIAVVLAWMFAPLLMGGDYLITIHNQKTAKWET
jgi:hypothetical protein